MAPMNPGYQPIPAPQLQVPRTGLVRSAVEVNDELGIDVQAREAAFDGGVAQPAWAGGLAFEAMSCETVAPRALGCDIDPPLDPKEAPANPGVVEYEPFLVMGADKCTTMDRTRNRRELARLQLLATESWQIAREVWEGAVARSTTDDLPNAYLASAATDVLDATPVGYVSALAELEAALLDCMHGARGMIHASPYTLTLWAEAGLVRTTDQGIILTTMDTIVVADAGYTGSGPGEDPGDPPEPADLAVSAWAYGTGLVHLRRGLIYEVGDETSQINRSTNTWEVFVERPVAAYWSPCCQLGINVDHTGPGASNGGINGGTP